jgi:hypothetical protein
MTPKIGSFVLLIALQSGVVDFFSQTALGAARFVD